MDTTTGAVSADSNSNDIFRFDLNSGGDSQQPADYYVAAPPADTTPYEGTWTGAGVTDGTGGDSCFLQSNFLKGLMDSATKIGQTLITKGNTTNGNNNGNNKGGGGSGGGGNNSQNNSGNNKLPAPTSTSTLMIAAIVGSGVLLTVGIVVAISLSGRKGKK